MTQDSDEELLNRYFEGDAEAYEIFFKRHFGRVVAFAIKNGTPQSDAADVAQETFSKLHRSIHLYEQGRPALAWFLTIAKNTCYDWRRRHQNFQKEKPLDEHAYQVRAPERVETNDTGMVAVAKGLSHLTPEQRFVVEKRVNDDMSFKDIGEAAGKSEVATRQLFQRAVKTLRRLIAADEPGEKK